jgi:hypothetical protein
VARAALVRHAADLTEGGITITTLGYGEDLNEVLLTMADAGRGSAYHVGTAYEQLGTEEPRHVAHVSSIRCWFRKLKHKTSPQSSRARLT